MQPDFPLLYSAAHLCKEDTGSAGSATMEAAFQFTLPQREGTVLAYQPAGSPHIISIHTPAKGVTWGRYWGIPEASDFNPHSRKGSDGRLIRGYGPWSLFQSTLPQGEWPYEAADIKWHRVISIHTPAKGVTMLPKRQPSHLNNFNPHSRKGSDVKCGYSTGQFVLFQSTLPQREWLIILTMCLWMFSFQSTLPQREWQITIEVISSATQISIHTPAKGVTYRDHP